MSSKRALRRKQCKGKVRYDTQMAAQAGIGRLRRNTGSTSWLQVYRCKHCSAWHFGHPPKNVRQAMGATA